MHAVALRVGEGGVAEARGESPSTLAPGYVRVHHVHHCCQSAADAVTTRGGVRLDEEAVLDEGLFIGCLEPPRRPPLT